MVIPPALCHYVLRSHLSTLGMMVAQVMVLLKVLMNPKKEQQLAKFHQKPQRCEYPFFVSRLRRKIDELLKNKDADLKHRDLIKLLSR